MSIDLRDDMRRKYGTPVTPVTTTAPVEVDTEKAFVLQSDSGRTIITAPLREVAQNNQGFTYLRGRYVEADTPNQNGALWTTDDLQLGAPTVAGGPLNWLHQETKIIGALTYPAVVLAAAFGIVVFLTASLLPKLLPMFLSLHVRLPASTRALLAASAFVRSSGLWVLMGLAGAGVVLASCIRRSTRVLRWCEYAFLRVPAFGSLLRHASVAHFSRAVGTLLTSGLTLREACIACATVNGRGLYDLHFLTMAETVNRGNQLSTHLLRHPKLFPELFGQMIAAGEQSGKLPEAFLYLSDHYEREIDEAANGLSALLEPALMLFTGALVGFIAIAVISPMYAITQSLHA